VTSGLSVLSGSEGLHRSAIMHAANSNALPQTPTRPVMPPLPPNHAFWRGVIIRGADGITPDSVFRKTNGPAQKRKPATWLA
jgi:hypothetical protein